MLVKQAEREPSGADALGLSALETHAGSIRGPLAALDASPIHDMVRRALLLSYCGWRRQGYARGPGSQDEKRQLPPRLSTPRPPALVVHGHADDVARRRWPVLLRRAQAEMPQDAGDRQLGADVGDDSSTARHTGGTRAGSAWYTFAIGAPGLASSASSWGPRQPRDHRLVRPHATAHPVSEVGPKSASGACRGQGCGRPAAPTTPAGPWPRSFAAVTDRASSGTRRPCGRRGRRAS